MNSEQEPLGRAIINGHAVRLYPSPLPGPDFPWHAMADLMDTLEVPEHWQEDVIDRFTQTWPEHCRMIPDASDTLAIGSSFCGLGFLAWLEEQTGKQLARERDGLIEGMVFQLLRQSGHLPPAEFQAICQIAASRHFQGAGSA